MKRTLGRAAPVLALALVAAACDQGLTELNVDPNNPPFVAAPAILPEAQQDAINRALGSNFNLTMMGLWSQSFAKIQYIDEDRYRLRSTTLDAHWAGFYSNALQDFQKIIEQGDSVGRPNWTAIGSIMQQWTFQIVTDTWGDVPYSEALQGAANTTPKYDAQKDIYYGMMAKLAAASAMIQPGGVSFGAEDGIYGGNMVAWRRFSNSLRLRMAMRISNVDPNKARTEFLAALAPAAGGVFTSNADNAGLHYSGAVPSDNPIYAVFHEGQRYDQVISKTTVDSLKNLNDPRLAVYADPAPNPAGCDDGGTPFTTRVDSLYCGYPNGTVTAEFFDKLSPIGAAFKEDPTAPSWLMTYSEVLFLRAEAAAKGWTGENAADLYRQGIRASMEQWGISDAEITAYLAQPAVAYAGLRSIYMQKWISLYGNGPEQFASWRRETVNGGQHAPHLTPAPQATTQVIPYRVYYPASEQSTNADNWSAAVTANGGATLYDKRVWWASVLP